MKTYTPQFVTHEFEPVCDASSRILILGTFPSVKSREASFYYCHPRNRFWKVLSFLTKQPLPETISQKKQFLLSAEIAVWDVVQSCEICGSSDSSIKNVTPANLSRILSNAPIRSIYTNGKTAFSLYQKYCLPQTRRPCVCLPSTSPANAAWSFERLTDAWGAAILPVLFPESSVFE